MDSKKKTYKSLSSKDPMSWDEIVFATKIEACQSAMFHGIKNLVNEYGKEIVADSLGWFQRLLEPETKEMEYETKA